MKHHIAAGHILPTDTECRWSGCHAERVDEVPLCERHFTHVGIAFVARRATGPLIPEGQRREHDERLERRQQAMRDQSVVYYVRIGGHVKIGHTINLKQRLGGLRVPVEAVLATEPGGRDLERVRHLEFANLREGRRENFVPNERLLSHIDMLREHYGPPRITTYPKIAS